MVKTNMRQGLLCLTAALTSGSQAWTCETFSRHPANLPRSRQPYATNTRLYSSGRNNGDVGGIFSKLGEVAKSVLPTNMFGSEKEMEELARRKEVKNQISGGLDTMLKDAPLGVRMMGKLISPLVSGMASTLAETMAEQQRTTEGVMDDARAYLLGDPAVTNLLGNSISLGAPFSQSSSTTSINGRTQTRVELAMPVNGPLASGTVRVLATQDGIAQMQLEVYGRRMDVSLASRQGWSPNGRSPSMPSSPRNGGDDYFIEAEIIDKQTK